MSLFSFLFRKQTRQDGLPPAPPVAPPTVPEPQPVAPQARPDQNRRLFESQSRDGEVVVSRAEHELLQQHFAQAKARFPGMVYLEWLQFFQYFVEPETYVEIGVETGASFAYAKPPTLAVGIDPLLEIKHELAARSKLFNLTSDEFFEQQDVEAVFEGQGIKLAFIDGMHTFDQVLKDFINIEKHGHRHSIVLFHDIFPVVPLTASRKRESVFWCGDTWKAIVLLRRHRPDLKIFTLPTYPSGLTVVSHLDPESQVLRDRFDALYGEAMGFDFDDFGGDLGQHLNEVPNEPERVVQLLNG